MGIKNCGVHKGQVDIRKFATKLFRVRSYYGVPIGVTLPLLHGRTSFRSSCGSMDIRVFFPARRPFQVRAPPPRRLLFPPRPDQLVDWEDIHAAIHGEDSDTDSVHTMLLERVFNHNRRVIDNKRLRDVRLHGLRAFMV